MGADIGCPPVTEMRPSALHAILFTGIICVSFQYDTQVAAEFTIFKELTGEEK
jgi:hypothetical protein